MIIKHTSYQPERDRAKAQSVRKSLLIVHGMIISSSGGAASSVRSKKGKLRHDYSMVCSVITSQYIIPRSKGI